METVELFCEVMNIQAKLGPRVSVSFSPYLNARVKYNWLYDCSVDQIVESLGIGIW